MRLAEEQLTKVTLNLFTSDVETLKTQYGWTTEIRNVIHEHVQKKRRLAKERQDAQI